MSDELITFLLGAAPISEIRGAVLTGVGVFHFTPLKAYALGLAGNLVPIVPFFIFLERFSDFLIHRVYLLNRLFTWLFERTRRIHGDHFHYWGWGPLALFIFVAIPLPMTGVWSGVIAAVVFGIPFWRSVIAISAGAAMAGAVVLALTVVGILAVNSI